MINGSFLGYMVIIEKEEIKTIESDLTRPQVMSNMMIDFHHISD